MRYFTLLLVIGGPAVLGGCFPWAEFEGPTPDQRPSSQNTGPGSATLTPSTGDMTLDQPGATITDVDVQGTVHVRAQGVTLRNCRITVVDANASAIEVDDGGSLSVDHCELVLGAMGAAGILGSNYVASYLDVHGTGHGIIMGSHVRVFRSYFHDLGTGSTYGFNAVRFRDGGSDVSLRFNYMTTGTNGAAIAIINGTPGDPSLGAVSDLVVEGNWLESLSVPVLGLSGGTPVSGTRVVYNRVFVTGGAFDHSQRPFVTDDPSPVFVGNVWDDTGAPVPLP